MTDPNQPSKYRYRLVFAKNVQIKFISHLDLALAWERALRRAQIPLAYSQGFNPRPKIQFASGLPLGTIGSAEIMDIVVTASIEVDDTLPQIRNALPVGIGLDSIEEVLLKSPTLQALLREGEYKVMVETEIPVAELTARVEKLLAAEEVVQIRRRRKKEEEFDLRPWLYELRLDSADDGMACLHMRVTAGQFGNLRPEAVLKALELEDNWVEIERTRLIFESE